MDVGNFRNIVGSVEVLVRLLVPKLINTYATQFFLLSTFQCNPWHILFLLHPFGFFLLLGGFALFSCILCICKYECK